MLKTKNVIDATDATFQQDVIARSHETTVVVDFWAPWCGPCRMLGPVLERLANEPDSGFVLAKINVDHNPRVAQQFMVRSIPAVKAFRGGEMVGGFVGAQPETQVRAFLRQVAPSASNGVRRSGQQLLAQGKWAEAEAAFRDALKEDGDASTRLGLAQALLRQGKGCAAETQLRDFPPGPEFGEAERLLPLAHYLCAAERNQLNGSDELTTLYRQAAGQISRRDYAAGLYNLLAIVRQDKQYRQGEPKFVMLALFALMGEQDATVQAYRQQLASALF